MPPVGLCRNFMEAAGMLVAVISFCLLRHAMTEEFANLETYRMDYLCGYGITLYSHGAYQVLVKFSPDNVVLVGNNCNFTINSGNYRMAVRAFDFGVVSDEGYACNRHLTMHLRFNSTSPIYGPPDESICLNPFQSPSSEMFYTTGDRLFVNYDFGRHPRESFKLLITPFHLGRCDTDEVRCARGHCIKHYIYCGDYNYCEDHSETCRDIKPEGDTPVTTIVLSVLVSVLVVALAVGIVYGCCCRNKRLSCRNTDTSDNQTPNRFWFDVFTSRGTGGGEVNEGAEFDDEPPDYDSLHPPSENAVDGLPNYGDVLQDTVKYKVSEQSIQYI